MNKTRFSLGVYSNDILKIKDNDKFLKESTIVTEKEIMTHISCDMTTIVKGRRGRIVKLFDNREEFISEMYIDGEPVILTSKYIFSDNKEHNVCYKFTDKFSNSIPAYAFSECNNIISFELSDNITKISENAFEKCNGLTEAIIPNSVLTIGSNAFYGCSNLERVTLGRYLRSMGDGAFSETPKLASVYCNSLNAPVVNNDAFSNVSENGVLYIPEGSDYTPWLSNSNFSLKKWTNISFIDDDLELNGYDMVAIFRGKSMDSETLLLFDEDDVSELQIDGVIVDIKRTIKFGDTKEHVVRYKFSKTYSKEDNTTYIEMRCFSGCLQMYAFKLSDRVVSIAQYAFVQCDSLSHVILPNSVKRIGSYAFYDCRGPESITFGTGLEYIEDAAFNHCTKLKRIVCNSTEAPGLFEDNSGGSSGYVFWYNGSNGVMYYPKGSDYSKWMQNKDGFLGKYGWTFKEF
jgi:hypothetical protein